MERRVLDFLEKLVHGISSMFVFGNSRAHEFEIPLLFQADLEAQGQPTAHDVKNSKLTVSDAQTQTIDQVLREADFYRRPDVKANSGSGPTVVLTLSMVAQISTVLQASRQIALLEEERAAILQDTQHESGLKDRLRSWTQSREFLRASLENSLAHMLRVTQLDEAPVTEPPDKLPELGVDAHMQDTISERTVSVDSINDVFLADPTAKNPEQVSALYEEAVRRMCELQELSDRREQDNEEDIMRYREALLNGEVDFPESELHQLHLEQERELTLNLIEADLELERTLANAQMWGLVMDDDDESHFRNRESCNRYDSGADAEDLPSTETIGDHARIEAWAEMVSDSPDEIVSIPEIDEWDTHSMEISSTISMRDSSNRLRIDRWQSYLCIVSVAGGAAATRGSPCSQFGLWGKLRILNLADSNTILVTYILKVVELVEFRNLFLY